MESEKFAAVTENAGKKFAEQLGVLREKAEHFIAEQVEVMKENGQAVELGEDELRLLKAYRAFKNRSAPGAVFKWQTPIDRAIVVPGEPSLIIDPREVTA